MELTCLKNNNLILTLLMVCDQLSQIIIVHFIKPMFEVLYRDTIMKST